VVAFLGGVVLLQGLAGPPGATNAQAPCETMPAGPARTDCYIGLSRISRQKSEIAARVARQQSDAAIYRGVTGGRSARKGSRTPSASPADWDWTNAGPR